MNVFFHLLGAPAPRGPFDSIGAFFARLATCPLEGHVERALWGGFHADRLGYAFAAGYEAALGRLFEHAGAPRPAGAVSLAATEPGGAHPRAIATRLEPEGSSFVLRGQKTFATLASAADELLVVASRGTTPDGKNDLRVVRVRRDAPGVVVADRPPIPYAPEIPHAVVTLDGVAVDAAAVLPGDGYTAWLKPFRTIEDVHVLAGVVGYLAGVARAHAWDRAILAELVSLGVSLVDVGARDPSAPLTHVTLAGLFSSARRLVASLEDPWRAADAAERERWQRDLPLMLVAENARTKRTETAFAALSRLAAT